MEPQLIKKPAMTLVGLVATGSSVSDLDIAGLWQRFLGQEENIKHRVEGKAYELHIEEEATPRMHFCLCGVEVQQIRGIPLEMFVKVIPACEFAVFVHHFKDGGYGDAFKSVYEWIKTSAYMPAYAFDIQCYDARFKGPETPTRCWTFTCRSSRNSP